MSWYINCLNSWLKVQTTRFPLEATGNVFQADFEQRFPFPYGIIHMAEGCKEKQEILAVLY